MPPRLTIWSGGQCGVDMTALAVARSFSIPTGGYAPHGWLRYNDLGKIISDPSLADFGLIEGPPDPKRWPLRTRLNASCSDLTVWFGKKSAGYWCTRNACHRASKPFHEPQTGHELASILLPHLERGPVILNVAGNRSFSNPAASTLALYVLTEALQTPLSTVPPPTSDCGCCGRPASVHEAYQSFCPTCYEAGAASDDRDQT